MRPPTWVGPEQTARIRDSAFAPEPQASQIRGPKRLREVFKEVEEKTLLNFQVKGDHENTLGGSK